MKRFSTLSIIREIQIRTSVRYQCIPMRVAENLKSYQLQGIDSYDLEELDPSCISGEM